MAILDDDNIIFINFWDKGKFKTNNKTDAWNSEPDMLLWKQYGLHCLTMRNQDNGAWNGYVGVEKGHISYNRTVDQLVEEKWFNRLQVYGGISFVGSIPEFNDEIWWFAFSTEADSLLPIDAADPTREKIKGKQTYKDFKFIRSQVNQLAKQLSKVGVKQ